MIKRKNKHLHNELSALSSRDFLGGLTIGMALVSSAWGAGVGSAHLPTGGLVVAGQANMTRQNNNLTITQSSSKLAIDWQNFAIGQGNSVKFVQPSANAVALNRVLGTDVSVIQGALQSNGQVFLLNPNGILFTPTALVNVGSLVASTLNLSNANFLAGNYQLEGKSRNAITQQGTVTATGGNQVSGTIALIAAKISNNVQRLTAESPEAAQARIARQQLNEPGADAARKRLAELRARQQRQEGFAGQTEKGDMLQKLFIQGYTRPQDGR
jgi:filamentous hemagglutinin family protein